MDKHAARQDEARIWPNKHAKFYNIDAIEHRGRRLAWATVSTPSCRLLSSSWLSVIPYEDADQYMKAAVEEVLRQEGRRRSSRRTGTLSTLPSAAWWKIAVPDAWANATTGAVAVEVPAHRSTSTRSSSPSWRSRATRCPYPRSTPHGVVPTGTTQYEKRGIAVKVPEWIAENCIQCNQCSLVCPHACIRPILADEDVQGCSRRLRDQGPLPARQGICRQVRIRMQVSPLGLHRLRQLRCISAPPRTKALVMKPLETQAKEEKNWEFAMKLPDVKSERQHRILLRAASSCSPCSSSPARARAAARRRMSSWSPSSSAIA